MRASQSLAIGLATPDTEFTDNKDGTVTHKRTGLMWQRCSVGQTWDDAASTCTGSVERYTYDDAIALRFLFAGHSDWRVPTANELASIVSYDKVNPAINTTMFPNTPGAFWSSSPYVGNTKYAWYVGFNIGYVYQYGHRGYSSAVRLVRASQSSAIGPNVVLFLHGMNSNIFTWNDVVTKYYADQCPGILNGNVNLKATANAQNTYCYRVTFGAYDAASPNKGLEKGLDGAWEYGESNGYGHAGDYSTYNELGTEVNKAINAIKRQFPNPKILLIAHSRGGLAARAFLQHPAFVHNKANVVGLITTGTPHKGTPLGRIYNYIATKMLNPDGSRSTKANYANDWQVIDLLRAKIKCDFILGGDSFLDARRPIIGYLSSDSSLIKNLYDKRANLPAIKYGEIVYNGTHLGKMTSNYNLFDEAGGDICRQVSREAEANIKGGTEDAPTPSINYRGDGIVAASSQGSDALPSALKTKPAWGVLHIDEPKQTAHIVDMSCALGFSWITSCPTNIQTSIAKQAKAPFKPGVAVSHDYDALVALPVDSLWQNWLAIITDDAQANQRDQYAVALGIKLRGSDNAAFYAEITSRLSDTNAPRLERARLARLLAEIATPSALEILTDALLNPECSAILDAMTASPLRTGSHDAAETVSCTFLSNAILTLADTLPEQPRRADLSAVLESAWLLPKQNQQQHNTLALALAKLGTPQGVELLLAAVRDLPSAKKKTLTAAEQQAQAAFRAMDEIINPDSEAVLSRAFMSHRATEAVFIAAGNGLVNLGRDDAAQRVLQRINELPDAAVPVGQQWLGRLSGKIDKAALRGMNKTLGLPRQRLLRQQMQEMVQ